MLWKHTVSLNWSFFDLKEWIKLSQRQPTHFSVGTILKMSPNLIFFTWIYYFKQFLICKIPFLLAQTKVSWFERQNFSPLGYSPHLTPHTFSNVRVGWKNKPSQWWHENGIFYDHKFLIEEFIAIFLRRSGFPNSRKAVGFFIE